MTDIGVPEFKVKDSLPQVAFGGESQLIKLGPSKCEHKNLFRPTAGSIECSNCHAGWFDQGKILIGGEVKMADDTETTTVETTDEPTTEVPAEEAA